MPLNELQLKLVQQEAYTSLLEIGSPKAWVQKMGRRKTASPNKMTMITQIIELGASAWPFHPPLADLDANAPGNRLRQVTLGQYWLWFALDLGDDYLWDQFEALLPEFDSTLAGQAMQRQAKEILAAIMMIQREDKLNMFAAQFAHELSDAEGSTLARPHA